MSDEFDQLVDVLHKLRGKCPWDRAQTADSIKPYLIEETYEVIEAIDSKEAGSLKEELGDLLIQILFHAEIAKENGDFGIHDVLSATREKLIRRHPHVYAGDRVALTKESVLSRWEEIKKEEQPEKSRFAGVPKALPALLKAWRVQEKVKRVGFDWDKTEDVVKKVREEWEELAQAIHTEDSASIAHELGDLFFSLVNLTRHLKHNPEEVLQVAVKRFTSRFDKMETLSEQEGNPLKGLSLSEMDRLWEQVKQEER